MAETKRQGGQIIEKDGKKNWLVLSESTGKKGIGYRHECGVSIMAAIVYHPIWDGPFAGSGSGRVHQETVPYCPKCEAKPDERGAPIDVPFPGVAVKR